MTTSYSDMFKNQSVEFYKPPQSGEVIVKIIVEGDNKEDVAQMMDCLCVSNWTKDDRYYKIINIDNQGYIIKSSFKLVGDTASKK